MKNLGKKLLAPTVTLDAVPAAQRQPGCAVSGVLHNASFVGYRDGDHIKGIITNKISDQPMLIATWRGLAYMSKVVIVDCARLAVKTTAGCLVLRADEVSLIEITARCPAKGRKFTRPITAEEYWEAIGRRADCFRATLAAKRERAAQ